MTYNVNRTTPPAVAAAAVARLFTTEAVDVALLQETQHCQAELAKIPGVHVVATHGHEKDETCIVVRLGHAVTTPGVIPATTHGWFAVGGGKTPPKWATVATVAGIRFSSWHTPPSVQSLGKRLGAPRRWAAYRELMGNLVHATGHRCVLGADWNVDANSDAGKIAAFPRATFAHLGLTRVFSARGTSGSRSIDGFGVKGVKAGTARALVGYPSDHKPCLVEITV